MSQEEILEVLEKECKALSLKQIVEKLNSCTPKVSHTLKALIKHHEVKVRIIDRNRAKELFGDKAPNRKISLYYLPKSA